MVSLAWWRIPLLPLHPLPAVITAKFSCTFFKMHLYIALFLRFRQTRSSCTCFSS